MLKLLQEDDPILRQRSEDVALRDPTIPFLVEHMLKTMYEHGGVGLAAVQIGVLSRVIVVAHPSWSKPEVMVNPKITSRIGLNWSYEGCLSVPKRTIKVERSDAIMVEYYEPTLHWARVVSTFDGFAARIVQHEMDHLDGILISDYEKHNG